MDRAARIRSTLYASLALAFHQPERSLVQRAMDNPLAAALQKAMVELPLPFLSGEMEELTIFLDEIAEMPEEQRLGELEVEYNRLLAGPGRPLVYPYGSMYFSGQVMGESTILIMESLAQERLSLSRHFKDLPDHIAVELEYMAYLCSQEAESWEQVGIETALEYRHKEYLFLQNHLGKWNTEFCDRILGVALSPFYLCLASITRDFIAWDLHQYLGRHPEQTPLDQDRLWQIRIDANRCILCEVCVRECPQRALGMLTETSMMKILSEARRCNGCSQCQRLCPKGAIHIGTTLLSAIPEKEQVIFQSPLVPCAQCGRPMMAEAAWREISLTLASQERHGIADKSLVLCRSCKLKSIALFRPP